MVTPQKHAVPLQIVMGALFCLLVGLVGLIIGSFSYRESSRMLLTAGKAVFERADQQIRLSSDKLFLPIQGAVIQSSHLPTLNHNDWQQRLSALPALASVLDGPKDSAGRRLYEPYPIDAGVVTRRAAMLGTSTTGTPNASRATPWSANSGRRAS